MAESSSLTHKNNQLEDADLKKHLEELQICQRDIDALGVKELEEILAVMKPIEKDSKVLKKPLFEQRNGVINKIPQFWLNVLRKCSKLYFFVEKEDSEFLRYLNNFVARSIDEGDQRGFKLFFYFDKENPFIYDEELSKSVMWTGSGDRVSTSSSINWKNSKNLNEGDHEKKTENTTTFQFVNWLNESEDPLSVNFMQLLEIWENPLQYYIIDNGETSNAQQEEIKEALEELEKLQEEINVINRKVDEEMLNVTATIGENHEEENKILFNKRNDIISNIPGFWLIALSEHRQLSMIIGEEEMKYLQYLTRIDVEHKDKLDDQKSSMAIHFYFSEDNPFFSNTVLSKEFFRGNDSERSCSSTPIMWKSDKEISQENRDMKEHNFFDWYVDNTDPESSYNITLPILQLWEDPVQYYLLSDDCNCSQCEEKEENEEPSVDDVNGNTA